MKRTQLMAGAILLVILGGLAIALGLGVLPGGDSGGDDIESFPTETTESANGSELTNGDDATTGPPYTFTIDSIEECGETCRDVTATLTNEQSSAASNVTVYSRIYAGNSTEGDAVWEGTESIGDLAAGESYTVTKRVELSFRDAYAIQQEDGWITVQTTVESDSGTITVSEQRQVI